MRLSGLILCFAIGLLSLPGHAVEADAYKALNRAAVETHILPRYDTLVTATAALDVAAKAFCTGPSAVKLPELRTAFDRTMDAWQDIQHVRFGPIDWFFRSQRFAFWPDQRNTITKQMAEMLAKHAAGAVDPDTMAKGSVATQGLPVLERLLFGEDANKLVAGNESVYRCRYVQAIATNLSHIAQETRSAWREGGDKAFASTLIETGKPDGPYRDEQEAALELFKSLYTAVELSADHKLARPLGASINDARPRVAESWRSERSLRNVQRNLEAAQNLYQSAFAPAVTDKPLDTAICDAFTKSLSTAAAMKMPLETAVQDKTARPQVEKLAAEVLALKKLLLEKLPPVLDIPVGFNALDGD